MKKLQIIPLGLTILAALLASRLATSGDTPPDIASLSKPQAGPMQMLFHGGTGPFQLQKRLSLDPNAPWLDIPEAKVTEINSGVYMAVFPLGTEDVAFYRVVSVGETVVE